MGTIDNKLVQDFGILSYLVYDDDDKYFVEQAVDIIIDSSASNKLNSTYEVIETINIENGLQAMLVQNGNDFTFVFRGTEEGLDWLNNLDMSTGNINQQMTAALLFVRDMVSEHSISLDHVTFTGHSLGGSLANMAGYVYGCDTYAFNAYEIEELVDTVTFPLYQYETL